MTLDQWLLVAVLVVSTTLYITVWLPTEVTALLTIGVLMLTGLLSAGDALAGFSSTATVTVGAMFVLSAGLMRTGALEAVTIQLARFSQGKSLRLLGFLAVVENFASAFMNNTPVVVMMIPVIVSICRRFQLRPSKFLLPAAYFATLGGTITLIGTSTNILVDDLYRRSGGPGFGLFDFTILGLIYAVVGGLFIIFVGVHLLPNRSPLTNLLDARLASEYISEVMVGPECKLIGRIAGHAFDRIAAVERAAPPSAMRRHRRIQSFTAKDKQGAEPSNSVELVEIFRDRRIYQAEELAKLPIREGDILLVNGTPKNISLFLQATKAELASVIDDAERRPVVTLDDMVIEAVVMPGSSLNGRLMSELQLGQNYEIGLMGVQHSGRQLSSGLRRMQVQTADVLLLRGKQGSLQSAAEAHRLLLVDGVENSLVRKTKNRTALIIMLLVIGLASFTEIPIVVLALLGAGAMILTRCLRLDEAVGSLESSTLLLLAGTIPIGTAMETTGLAQAIVDSVVALVGHSNPVLFLAAFYIVTALLTELLSNNAVAVLMTPIALSLAATLGINPTALLVAVMFGASASFMTPFGYQTNAMVMGPGGYKFVDYLKIGAPLQVIMITLATICIPLFWPL
jgi:di/tricarboxylate transporter